MLYIYTVALVFACILTASKVGEPRGDVFIAVSGIILIVGIGADKICAAIRERR